MTHSSRQKSRSPTGNDPPYPEMTPCNRNNPLVTEKDYTRFRALHATRRIARPPNSRKRSLHIFSLFSILFNDWIQLYGYYRTHICPFKRNKKENSVLAPESIPSKFQRNRTRKVVTPADVKVTHTKRSKKIGLVSLINSAQLISFIFSFSSSVLALDLAFPNKTKQ